MNNKIVYIIDNSIERNSKNPLFNKLISQLNNLKKIGFNTSIYDAQKNIFISKNAYNEKDKSSKNDSKNPVKRYLNYIRNKIKCDINIYKLIPLLDEETIIYMRYPTPTPILLLFIRRKRRCKIVMEFQSIEFLEYKIHRWYLFMLLELIFGSLIRRKLNGMVSVTNQIKEYESLKSGDPNIPSICIGNGINVASLKMRSIPEYLGKELHILFLANISPWHGADRLLNGMLLYSGKVNLVLHVVGDDIFGNFYKNRLKSNDIQKKITFHGYLTGSKLDDLFNICHISMGSLGMHRIGLEEATPLKTREYCSRGIPFFTSYNDPDLASFPFILKIPADNTPVNIEEIIGFVEKIYADQKHNEKMRLFALNNLDWSVKMMKLKLFLNGI